MPDESIVVAVDGSSLGNPGPGGWCWYVGPHLWAAGARPDSTNNAMELEAVRAALVATAHLGAPVHLVCDSKLVVESLETWRFGWKKRGWRKADGAPIRNREVIEAIDALLVGRQVTFEWVRGHSGHPLNEAADIQARAAAEALKRGK